MLNSILRACIGQAVHACSLDLNTTTSVLDIQLSSWAGRYLETAAGLAERRPRRRRQDRCRREAPAPRFRPQNLKIACTKLITVNSQLGEICSKEMKTLSCPLIM